MLSSDARDGKGTCGIVIVESKWLNVMCNLLCKMQADLLWRIISEIWILIEITLLHLQLKLLNINCECESFSLVFNEEYDSNASIYGIFDLGIETCDLLPVVMNASNKD